MITVESKHLDSDEDNCLYTRIYETADEAERDAKEVIKELNSVNVLGTPFGLLTETEQQELVKASESGTTYIYERNGWKECSNPLFRNDCSYKVRLSK